MQGDTSEEGRARLSKIQLSLDEANLDLQDTERERHISEQQNMLDNMYEQYEDLMQNLFKDTDKILEDGIKVINENGYLIKGILDKKAEDYGYDYSDNFRDILDSFNTNGEVVNGIQYSLNGDESSIASKLDEQNKYIQAKYDYGNSTNGNNSGNGGVTNNSTTPKANTIDKITPVVVKGTQTKNGQTVATNQTQEEMSNSFFTEIGAWLSNGHATGSTKNVKSDLNKKLKKYWGVALSGKNKDKEFKALAKKLGVSKKVDYTKNGAVYKKLESEIKGFRTGGIVRASGVPSDGDYIPIRVNPNETILTQKFTDMLPDTVNIMDNLTKAINFPDYSNIVPNHVGNTQSFGDINVQMDLPNVTDYKSFCDEMQNNNKAQKLFTIATKDLMDKGRITNNIQRI